MICLIMYFSVVSIRFQGSGANSVWSEEIIRFIIS